jgi:hypothetical protein
MTVRIRKARGSVSRDFNTRFNLISHSTTSDRLINGFYIGSISVVFRY